jgi:hypothetical protein
VSHSRECGRAIFKVLYRKASTKKYWTYANQIFAMSNSAAEQGFYSRSKEDSLEAFSDGKSELEYA